MIRVYYRIVNHLFDEHLKTNIKLLTNPTELNKIVTHYFVSDIELKKSNAGNKLSGFDEKEKGN